VFPKRDSVDAGVGFLLLFLRRVLTGPPNAHHARSSKRWRPVASCAATRIPTSRRTDCRWEGRSRGRRPTASCLRRRWRVRQRLHGRGIYYAMISGQHAGETAADAVLHGDCSAARLADYDRRWRAEIGVELMDSMRIQRRLFAPPRNGAAVLPGAPPATVATTVRSRPRVTPRVGESRPEGRNGP
jgi:hypothetical protein